MEITIWDLKKGQRFKTTDGTNCEVITPTEDGKGLVARYLDGTAIGEEDFFFEGDIDLDSCSDS